MLENGSYWQSSNSKICLWKNSQSDFWVSGFTILQNIDDRLTTSKAVIRARDPVGLSNPANDAKLHKYNDDEYMRD